MRVAAVDLGSNSTRLLIADVVDGVVSDVIRIATVTGLGRGVDGSGRIAEESIARTCAVLNDYARLIDGHDVDRVRAIATSACRDAANSSAFLEAAHRSLGRGPEIISGDEEAALSYSGATSVIDGDVVVVDIGGGSTEFVSDSSRVSVDIGSVRLTDRCLPEHPASAAQLTAARAEAESAVAERQLASGSVVVGVAGTWTSLMAMHLDLDVYDPDVVEGMTLPNAEVTGLVEWLATLSLAEKQSIPSLEPARAAVILGGAVVAEAALAALTADGVMVSEHDILDGLTLRESARGEP